ncbi:MAG: pyridoxamine 5'-phosphate oxidase family protein [Actinomycetes bacterium]
MDDWPDYVVDILRNDRCVALATRTPAAGVALTPVTTVGMCDIVTGTVTTSTSFGNFAKLRNIDRDPRVALIFHTRSQSPSTRTEVLVVQGRAWFPTHADPQFADPYQIPRWTEFMPSRKRGALWDWVGQEYYDTRVPVTIQVERIVVLDGPNNEVTDVIGVPISEAPITQTAPKNGTAPRIASRKYAKRLKKCDHTLLGWVDGDGFPTAVPVDVSLDGDLIHVPSPGIPHGSRRAGLLAHWFESKLVGQGSVVTTGWLEHHGDGCTYAPHTLGGYEVPASDAMFAIGGGLGTKFGYRKAKKLGYVRDGVWQR